MKEAEKLLDFLIKETSNSLALAKQDPTATGYGSVSDYSNFMFSLMMTFFCSYLTYNQLNAVEKFYGKTLIALQAKPGSFTNIEVQSDDPKVFIYSTVLLTWEHNLIIPLFI